MPPVSSHMPTAMAAAPDEPGRPRRPDVDPCAVLTKEEISEQLLLTVSPPESANWPTNEFAVTPTERHPLGEVPQERGKFIIEVARK